MDDGIQNDNRNFENALITAVISNKDIRTVIKRKITREFFFNTVGQAAWGWLLEWYANPNYPDTPSWDSFMNAFPDFEPEEIDESVVVLCDHVRHRKIYSDIAGLINQVGKVTLGDPLEGFEELKLLTSRLSSAHTVDNAVDVRDVIGQLRDEYLRMAMGEVKLKGKPYPWPTLNESTLGIQGGQLIIIYGRPKSKKTWMAAEMVKTALRAGARCHVFSQELTTIEYSRRHVALECALPYSAYVKGELPADIEERFFEQLEEFASKPPLIVDQLDAQGESVLVELSAKIDDSRANVVLIDGAHNLGSWKELYPIIKGLKRVAKSKDVAIIITTHQKRGKKESDGDAADDFAHSDAFYQECDVALRVTSEVENLKNHEVHLYTSALREGTPCAFLVNTKLAYDLSEKRRISFGEEGAGEAPPEDAELDGEDDDR